MFIILCCKPSVSYNMQLSHLLVIWLQLNFIWRIEVCLSHSGLIIMLYFVVFHDILIQICLIVFGKNGLYYRTVCLFYRLSCLFYRLCCLFYRYVRFPKNDQGQVGKKPIGCKFITSKPKELKPLMMTHNFSGNNLNWLPVSKWK